ncbi:MAG: hypothetical protein AAF221_08925 [Pseudomonadota bacterium]
MIFSARLSAFGLCVALLFGSSAASAQSAQQLQRDISRLEKQVKALQRNVFKGDTTYFQQDNEPAGQSAVDAAGMLVRLDQLEESLRALTGRAEEMAYSQRQLQAAFTDFRAQTNYRLDALDGANSSEGASAVTAAANSSVSTVNTAVAATTADVAQPAAAKQDVASNDQARAPATADEAFSQAFDLAKRDQFDSAEQAFLLFITDYSDDPLASNGHYWLGRVYTAKKQLDDAADAFFNGYYKYPDGNKAPENLLALASTLRVMDSREDACKAVALLQSRIADKKYPSISNRVLQGIDNESSILGCQ